MQFDRLRRREFITLVAGAAAWPIAARAQQIKRIGVLMSSVTSDAAPQTYLKAFVQGLRRLGWIDGENLRIETRWTAGDPTLSAAYAADLVELLKPDVRSEEHTSELQSL